MVLAISGSARVFEFPKNKNLNSRFMHDHTADELLGARTQNIDRREGREGSEGPLELV